MPATIRRSAQNSNIYRAYGILSMHSRVLSLRNLLRRADKALRLYERHHLRSLSARAVRHQKIPARASSAIWRSLKQSSSR